MSWKGRNKYNAVRTFYNGEWYDSKREAEFAKELDMLRKARTPEDRVINVWRQVTYVMMYGADQVNYKLDFEKGYV